MGENFAGDVDAAKKELNDQGQTVDDDKIYDFANSVQNYMEGEFIYILSNVTPFPPATPDWYGTLCTQGVVAYFWFKENNDDKLWKEFQSEVARQKVNRFMNQPALTR